MSQTGDRYPANLTAPVGVGHCMSTRSSVFTSAVVFIRPLGFVFWLFAAALPTPANGGGSTAAESPVLDLLIEHCDFGSRNGASTQPLIAHGPRPLSTQ